MFRAILFILGFLFFVSVARAVLSIVSKAAAGAFQNTPAPRPPSATSAGNELKKDPVCGTFISTGTAFQKFARGETYYFCSTQCRDQFS